MFVGLSDLGAIGEPGIAGATIHTDAPDTAKWGSSGPDISNCQNARDRFGSRPLEVTNKTVFSWFPDILYNHMKSQPFQFVNELAKAR